LISGLQAQKVQAIEFNRIDEYFGDVFDTSGQLDREIAVSEMCMSNKKSKVSFRRGILLGALALTVLAGVGTASYGAASGSSSQVLEADQMSIFDPFLLNSTIVTARERSGSGSVYSGGILLSDRPAIRIPSRPVLRSPFRPPLS
jgi:hypothetical protein